MAQEKGTRKEELDERLVELRDEVLIAGERVVDQEPGDQGQAVVLTDSRIIILKAGITATGVLNGRRIGIYPLAKITNVSVRRGPIGAVLQVCGEGTALTENERPESIAVFSFPDKVKYCDAIAAAIEKALGKPVERIEPKPEGSAPPPVEAAAPEPEPVVEACAAETPVAAEPAPKEKPKERKPRGGRVAKSLAEEMYEEYTPPVASAPVPAPAPPEQPEPPAVEIMQECVPEPVPESVSEPVVEMPVVAPPPEVVENILQSEPDVAVEESVAEPEPEPEPEAAPEAEQAAEVQPEFRPNPNLPRPVRRKRKSSGKSLVLIGSLAAILLMGIAVTAPLRQADSQPPVEINVTRLTNNASVLRRQFVDVSAYRSQAMEVVRSSDSSVASVRSAVSSGNLQSVRAAVSADAGDSAWQKLRDMPAPSGLAAARESLVSGLFLRKSAVEDAATGTVSAADTLRKLAEADQQIAGGFEVIDGMLRDLESSIPNSTAKGK